MRKIFLLICLSQLLLSSGAEAAEKGLTVKTVRYSSYALFTRIVFEVEAAGPYVLTRSEDNRNVLLSSYEGPFVLKSPLPVIRDGVIAGVDAHAEGGRIYAVIHLDAAAGEVKDFTLRGPDRIVIDIAKGAAPLASAQTGDRPIVIVLDAGHGGKDTGLLAGQGLEKAFDLEIVQAVRKLLQKAEHIKVVLTREKDQTLSFDERAAIANTAGATVFVSIHAAPGATARVYIQDLSDDAGVPAPRPASGDFLGFEAGNEQQEMVWGKQQATHAEQSGGLGRRLARQLSGNNTAEPMQAPLAGLKAVDAAAVMVEIGMDQDRAKAVEDIAGGISQYVRENQ